MANITTISIGSQLKSFATVSTICFGLSQTLAYIASSKTNGFILNKLAFISVSIQWVVYIFQASGLVFGNKRTEKFYDLTGALTFQTLSLLSIFLAGGLKKFGLRQKLLTSTVLIWSFRLGSFLFDRIRSEGGVDSRFNKVRPYLFEFWNFWTIQGLWVFLTSLPVLVLNDSTKIQSHLNIFDFIGLGIWLIGLSTEILADNQKKIFKKNPSNKGKFINEGLWKLSRHPNYFGEIFLWFGVFISASQGFERPGQWLSIISPIFVSFLLINISGIPLLEKSANKHWGNDEAYKKYKRDVPVLIPFIGRRGDALF
eukprot:gene21511-27855_t